MKLRCTAVSDQCENAAHATRRRQPNCRDDARRAESRLRKQWNPVLSQPRRASFIHSALTKDTEEHCCFWVWAIDLKKKKKKKRNQNISTCIWIVNVDVYSWSFLFFLLPPSKRPHNASVLLPTRVTNRLNAIQLSWGNHGASVLTS